MSTYRMLINGEAKAAEDGSLLSVINPATEAVIAEIPNATRNDLNAAVAAAKAAFPEWRDHSIPERQALVTAFADAVAAEVESLAALFTAEQGRPLDLARAEIMNAVTFMKAIARFSPPVTVLEETPERRVEVHHVPLGVVAAIAPWNFPVILALWKVAPALVAGNTVVLKPSPFTPLVMLRIGEIVRGILPPGVFNIVTGGDQLGPWLSAHPDIDKISFTGSTATGRRVMAGAAPTLKRLTLELGGNDPAIVLGDVDIAETVPKIFWAAFRNSGQICIAAKRILVHHSIYDRFRDELAAFASTIRLGDGAEAGVQMGPIQNRLQYERVNQLIADSRSHGHVLIAPAWPVRPGFFIPPIIVDNPPDGSRIVREEPFGPIVPLQRFSDIEEVIARANDSEFGLAASIWTKNLDLADNIAGRLECGTVWINDIQYLRPGQPFGGHKQSGIGVEGGVEGLLEYTNTKTIVRRIAA
ncbi:aldehyde dehydrogenase family protein (plasmid) [Sphingobium sp. SJ10-10]|uniref:aldehyde dehydrogenase family protein n=1 Tax=Sphingobium sp. SJ10-10 TaxID=3114999 RepID=UPI002E183D0F|nr:aldehyde dehydrogenase family protein [Sphingobium sp. SJ10-10]